MSQRRAGPCGLFSRAEEKKLSDDEIEEGFTSSATVCRTLFHALRLIQIRWATASLEKVAVASFSRLASWNMADRNHDRRNKATPHGKFIP
jgi:hypothetical protein